MHEPDPVFHRYMQSLLRSERMPETTLKTLQDDLRRRLVRHAHQECPFYRDRLSGLIGPGGDVDLDRWSTIPVLSRAEATEHAQAMRAGNLAETLGPSEENATSGTEGVPLRFSVNKLARIAYNAAFTRFAQWHGMDVSQPIALIRIKRAGEAPQYPDGLVASGGWSSADPTPLVHQLDLLTPASQQVEWLQRANVRYVVTSPSNALALAFACTPEQAASLNLDTIISISETVLPGVRELIRERLGAKLIAMYSTEEIGTIATECPVHQHYHVTAENTFVEVVDDNGEAAPGGQPGRVLLTALYNYATPFIRYDIGDVAIASANLCSCGRTLPVIEQVLGRTRNAFVLADGTRIWLRVWNAKAMERLAPCREFQLVQLDFKRFEYRYVPADDRKPDAEGLIAYLREQLQPSVQIELVRMDSLPRGSGGKLDPFVSQVPIDAVGAALPAG